MPACSKNGIFSDETNRALAIINLTLKLLVPISAYDLPS
jgi:hypothetical protein